MIGPRPDSALKMTRGSSAGAMLADRARRHKAPDGRHAMLKRIAALSIATLLPAGAASAAEPVKVGALLTYSGVYAQIGEEMTNAMELAFAEVGNSVAGRPIQIIRADTEAKPNVALQKAKELVGSDNVDFLVGPVSSG